MLISLQFSAIFFIVVLLLGTIPSSLNLVSADDMTKSTPPVPQRPNLPELPTFSLPSQSVRSTVIHAASTFTAVQSGNWNVGATWGGTVPGDSDDKIIPLGINVTVTTPTNNTGIITNSGNITISNAGINSYGIKNIGTVNNSGKITISNSGNNSIGINSTGTITNSGKITISNSNVGTGTANGSVGIITNGGIINNNSGGLVTVSNFGDHSIGIDSLNLFNNTSGGQIIVSNNATNSTGIFNNGGIINNNSGGLVTVSNSGLQSQGIFVDSLTNTVYSLTNTGTVSILNNGNKSIGIINAVNSTNNSGGLITISNSGFTNTGIDNGASLSNFGTITILNTGVNTRGILNENVAGIINSGKIDNSGFIDNIGTITNSGTIAIKNSGTGSLGLNNNGSITNSGIISINNSGPNSKGIENNSGKTITNSGTILIKNSPTSSLGIENGATINNSGTISMQNPNASYYNIYNPSGNPQTSVIINSGTIYNCFGLIGPHPTSPIVACPTVSINDISMTEGNSGTKNFNFTVTRSGVTSGTSFVNFTTSDGTATLSNSDYISKSGNLTFAGGQTTKTLTIQVIGDINVEPNETFNVHLLNCGGCSITHSPGVGTIQNDDLGCIIPMSGDWTVSSSCILASTSSAPRNVIVLSGIVLTIPSGLSLNIDFTQFHLLVNSGGTVLIKAGGAIK